jgi:uroporphyrinogen III methyltransferase/synthase
LGRAQIGAIGPATAKKLMEHGIRADLVPKTYQAESVVEAFQDKDMAGKRVLLPRALQARTVLPEELGKMGALAEDVAAYQTLPVREGGEELFAELMAGKVDMVTFASSSTVENFRELLGPEQFTEAMQKTAAACIGPITADTARKLGVEPAVVAREFTMDGLCRDIAEYFKGNAAR